MSVRSKKHRLFFLLWASLVLASAFVPRPAAGRRQISKSSSAEIAQRVKTIFAERCFQCHGLNGKAAKNIFALDRVRLIQMGAVIPGDAASPLLKAVESGVMPKGGPELSAEDKAAAREWILAGAPDWADQSAVDVDRAFISESSLLSKIAVDTSRQLAEEKFVIRAGVRSSGVSQNNRAMERHVAPFGAYWRSFDFRSNLDDQNIFANPLRLNAAGGEIIFNLPNGLQAYFLADTQGRRLDMAPLEIVSDRNQPDDPLIRNGRSCMGCHFAGIKSFRDDVRAAIQRQGLQPNDLERAMALYATQDAVDRAVAEDEARFLRAEHQLGGKYASKRWDTNSQTEPVNALSRRFESELTIELAAAEAGLETRDFSDRIRWDKLLNNLGLGQLLAPGGAIKRDVWEKHFGDVARELQLGVFLPAQRLAARWNPAIENASPAFIAALARQRLVQAPAAQRAAGGGSAQNETSDLLRSARTVFFRSESVYLRPELVENALRGRAEFQSLDIVIVKDRNAADLVIDLNRPLFTFDYTWSVMHRQTSALVASGKVTAFNGAGAAPKIAKELIKQMQSSRAPR
jgi:mono/diheme cytochrome c family protein